MRAGGEVLPLSIKICQQFYYFTANTILFRQLIQLLSLNSTGERCKQSLRTNGKVGEKVRYEALKETLSFSWPLDY